MEPFSALLALCAGNSPIPANSLHKGQWRGALKFYLICAWINDWVNNREAGDLRRHHGHYDVNVMNIFYWTCLKLLTFAGVYLKTIAIDGYWGYGYRTMSQGVQEHLLPKWINCNLSRKLSIIKCGMKSLIHSEINVCTDEVWEWKKKQFHPVLYWACDYSRWE